VFYASCYSFKYSARPGTPAANMQGLLPEKVKEQRLASLNDLLNEQRLSFNNRTVGLTIPVLLEKDGGRPGQLAGRTAWNQSIHVAANPRLMGQIVDVTVTQSHANSLTGQLVTIDSVVHGS
jgi:tRNA-2-methylthio-N6-dimethylallyladenosine synthase